MYFPHSLLFLECFRPSLLDPPVGFFQAELPLTHLCTWHSVKLSVHGPQAC